MQDFFPWAQHGLDNLSNVWIIFSPYIANWLVTLPSFKLLTSADLNMLWFYVQIEKVRSLNRICSILFVWDSYILELVCLGLYRNMGASAFIN